MVSGKQKAILLASGGAAAAAVVWLRYARSAAGARRFLGKTGAKAGRTLSGIQKSLSSVAKRMEEVDRIVHELALIGGEQRGRAQTVVQDTLRRFELTTDAIRENLLQSSEEITSLVKDVRTAVGQSLSSKPSQAA